MAQNIITIEIDSGKSIQNLEALKKSIKEQQEQLAKITIGTDAYKAQEKVVASLKTQLNILTTTTKEQTKIAELNKVATESQKNSFNQLSAQYRLNTIELNKMSSEEKTNTEAGKKLVAETLEISNAMKVAKQATGDFRLDVGNYSKAMETANMSLGEMKKELRELRNMSFKGLNAGEIKLVKEQMAGLTEGIRDFQEQNRAASEKGIPGVVAGLQGLIATTQLVTGTLSLFGVENERLEKSMMQLIGVSQALATVEDIYQKKKIQVMAIQIKDMAIKGALVVKNTALAIATGVVTAAQWLWNVAMTANPIGLIIVGITALIAGIYLLVANFEKIIVVLKQAWDFLTGTKDEMKANADAMKIAGKETDSLKNKTSQYANKLKEFEDLRKNMLKTSQREIDLMKARGDSIDSIKIKERELIQQEMANAQMRIKMLSMFGNITKSQVDAQKEILDELQFQLKLFDTTETQRKQEIADENLKKQQENAKKSLEKLQEAEKERLKKIEEYRKTQKENDAKFAKDDEDRLNNRLKIFDEETATLKIKLKQRFADGLIDEEQYKLGLDLIEQAKIQSKIDTLTGLKGKEKELADYQNELSNMVLDNQLENNAKELADSKKTAEEKQKLQEDQIKKAMDLSAQVGDLFAEMMTSSEKSLGDFFKKSLALLLDSLQQVLIASIFKSAAIEAGSKPFPLNIATAAIKTAAISAAFGIAKAKLMQPPKAETGMIIGGQPHSNGGTMINAERGEAIINKRSVAMFPRELSAINQAGGGIPFMQNGGLIANNITTTNLALEIEKTELTNKMLVRAISSINPVVMVDEINSKLNDRNKLNRVSIL